MVACITAFEAVAPSPTVMLCIVLSGPLNHVIWSLGAPLTWTEAELPPEMAGAFMNPLATASR